MAANLLLEGTDLEALLVRAHQEGGASARIVRAEKIRRGGFLGFFAREGFEVAVEIPNDSRGSRGTDDGMPPEPQKPPSSGTTSASSPPAPATDETPVPGLAKPGSLLGLAERASAAERAAAKAVAAQAAYEAATRTVPDSPAAPAPLQVEAITGRVVEEPVATPDGGRPVVAEEFVTEKFSGQAFVYDDEEPDGGHEIEYVAEHVEFTRIEFPAVVDAETAAKLGGEIAAELGSGWTIETSVEEPAGSYDGTDATDETFGTDEAATTDEAAGEYADAPDHVYAPFDGPRYPDDEFAEVHYGEVAYSDPQDTADLADPADPADLADLADFEAETAFADLPGAPGVPYQGSAGSLAHPAAVEFVDPATDEPEDDAETAGRPLYTSLVDQLRASVRLGRHREDGARHTPDHPAVAALNPFSVDAEPGEDDEDRRPGEPTPAQADAWNQVLHEGAARATTVVPRTRARRSRNLPSQRASVEDQAETTEVSETGFSETGFSEAQFSEAPFSGAQFPELAGGSGRPGDDGSDWADQAGWDPEDDAPVAAAAEPEAEPEAETGTETGTETGPHDLDEPATPVEDDGPRSRSSLRSSTENAWRLLRQWRPGSRRNDDAAEHEAELEAEAAQWTAEDLEDELAPSSSSEIVSFTEAATNGEVPAEAATIRSFDQLSSDREALRELGVPAAWTRHLQQGDRFTSVVAMLGRLPEVAIDEDTPVIAVVGAPAVVELEAHRTALDLPTDGRPRAVVKVSAQAGVDRRSALARSKRTRPVVVAVPIDSYDEPAEIRKVLAGVRAGAVIAVIDAARPLDEITRWVESLERVDALALDGALAAGRPAAVLALDVPVIRVDGISVDRIGWAALLCAQLTAQPEVTDVDDDFDFDDDFDDASGPVS